jgi:hypothetical protein
VAASSWFIDEEIERSVVSCSEALWAILATISLAALIWSEMRFSASPASPTRRTPWSTWLEERAIWSLISLAAAAERWASSRTSWATTAKPLPDSPARAASTPAFSASRLVWKAISSTTPMILVISDDDFSMPLIIALQNRNAPPLLIEGAFVHRWWNPKRSKP